MGTFIDTLQSVSKADREAYEYPYQEFHGIKGYQRSCSIGTSVCQGSMKNQTEEMLWRTMCWGVDINNHYPAGAEVGEHFREFYRILRSGYTVEETGRRLFEDAAGFNVIAVHSMPLCFYDIGPSCIGFRGRQSPATMSSS